MIQTHRITLLSCTVVADGTLALTFTKPESFSFTAGQYVIVKVLNPAYEDSKPSFRSFSIAAAPSEEQLLFAMRRGTSAFKRSIAALTEGAEVEIKGPLGDFILPKDKKILIVFLVGGIGITPVRSILMQEVYEKSMRPITLFYSNRYPAAAAFLSQLEHLPLKNYTCISTMTDEEKLVSWSGKKGKICTPLLKQHCGDFTVPQFYIVGTGSFIEGMKEMLTACGVDKTQMKMDNFGKY